jgi:hypothetical protein
MSRQADGDAVKPFDVTVMYASTATFTSAVIERLPGYARDARPARAMT